MENKLLKITHTADIQVKNRNLNLYTSTQEVLLEIEKHVKNQQSSIHIISGDLFEYATPNDSERKLIYNHISRLTQIPTLSEIVIIAGNHDLQKENKQLDTQVGYNPISIFADVIKYFDSDKIVYCEKSGIYESVKFDVRYIVYSLEDKNNWDKLKTVVDEDDKLNICLYHAMIREYVNYAKLPLQPSVLNKLYSLDLFPNNSYILAGDIHKEFETRDIENNKLFVYPGAPMQHTFGEGNYIDVSDKKITSDKQYKFIKLYLFDGNKLLSNELCYIPTKVAYNTIILDSKSLPEPLIYNLEQELKENLEVGNIQTFIKIKSCNSFLNLEKKIREIISLITCADISFEYDKFIQKETYSDNKVIQDLVDEKTISFGNVSPTITSDNVDELILDTTQIRELFDSVLNNMVDNVSSSFGQIDSDTIHDEILNLFMLELESTTEQSSKRYDIKFVNIETNNFMRLGENNIPLNIDGITRILGTNKIGKTTLYKMIRWCLTGQIYEGMSNNQVVKNSLLVFNKNLIDNDEVNVKMELIINGQKVIITRNLKRTWKRDVNNEQKILKNWGDFVSNLDRELKLDIYKDDELVHSINGEQAQNNITKFFGSTINNILFINQLKINQILTSSSDTLNELILNYIGVDYLDKLESRLDDVKSKLFEVAKPKRKYDDISESISDARAKIKTHKQDVETQESKLNELTEDKHKNEKDQQTLNDELTNLGNIEKQISNTQKQLTEFENKDYTPKEKLVKPKFDEIKPVLKIDVEEQKLTEAEDTLKIKEEELIKIGKEYEELYNNQLTESVNEIKEKFVSKIESLTEEKTSLNNEIKKIFEDCYTLLKTKHSVIYDEIKSFEEKKTTSENQLQTIDEKSEKIDKQLESGVCSECGRAFSDDWDSQKEILESNKIKLQTLKTKVNSTLEETKQSLEKLNADIVLIDSYIKLCMSNNVNVLDINLLKNTEFKTKIDDINKQLENKSKQITDCEKFKTLFDSTIKLKVGEFELKEKLDAINSNSGWLINIKNILSQLYSIHINHNNLEEVVDTINDDIKLQKDNISKLKDLHYNMVNDYNNKLEQHNKKCNDIDLENEEIVEYNNSLVIDESKIKTLKIELENLELKLPKYNELQNKLTGLQRLKTIIENSIEELNKRISLSKLSVNSVENQEKQYLKEQEDYFLYEKNNIIWKIYSKLIKTKFKDIVFEYYRTFLNNTLNHLLSDVSFKLYWDKNTELTMVSIENGVVTYQTVQQASGMESTFLGLALIYTIQVLSVKNTLSHIFIDELSGTLNKGLGLSYTAADYQEMFVKIISKFKDKSLFIIDHNIDNIGENTTYEVIPNIHTSKYILK